MVSAGAKTPRKQGLCIDFPRRSRRYARRVVVSLGRSARFHSSRPNGAGPSLAAPRMHRGQAQRGMRFNGVHTRLGSILFLRASTGTEPFRRTGSLRFDEVPNRWVCWFSGLRLEMRRDMMPSNRLLASGFLLSEGHWRLSFQWSII
jgi:hypothetical protein